MRAQMPECDDLSCKTHTHTLTYNQILDFLGILLSLWDITMIQLEVLYELFI